MDPFTVAIIIGICVDVLASIPGWYFVKHQVKQALIQEFEDKLKKQLQKNREWYDKEDKTIQYEINPMFNTLYMAANHI